MSVNWVTLKDIASRRGTRIPEDVSLMAISDGQAPSFLHPNVIYLRHSGAKSVSAPSTFSSAWSSTAPTQ